jgi:hypothetical protein
MNVDTIRECVLRRPFHPFVMRMNDGREITVPHPEYVAVSRRVVMVIDPATEAGTWLEPVLIASVKLAEQPAAKCPGNGNGQGV